MVIFKVVIGAGDKLELGTHALAHDVHRRHRLLHLGRVALRVGFHLRYENVVTLPRARGQLECRLHRRAFHICAGTGPTPPTSAPGLGPPLPHLHWD